MRLKNNTSINKYQIINDNLGNPHYDDIINKKKARTEY